MTERSLHPVLHVPGVLGAAYRLAVRRAIATAEPYSLRKSQFVRKRAVQTFFVAPAQLYVLRETPARAPAAKEIGDGERV